MPFHCGYALFAQLKDVVIQDMADRYYDILPMGFNLFLPLAPSLNTSAPAFVQFKVFAGKPTVQSLAFTGNTLQVSTIFYGTVSGNSNITGAFSYSATLAVAASIQPAFQFQSSGGSLYLDISTTSITSVNLVSIGPSSIPTKVVNLVNSASFLNATTILLQASLSGINSLSPPLFQNINSLLGSNSSFQFIGAAIRVDKGYVSIGVDLALGGTVTQGTMSNAQAFYSKSDIAICINPVVLQPLADYLLPAVQQQAAAESPDVVITKLSLGVSGDHLHASVDAVMEAKNPLLGIKADAASATVSMDFQPELILTDESSIESDEEYGEQTYTPVAAVSAVELQVLNINTDVDLSWWVWADIGFLFATFAAIGPAGAIISFTALPFVFVWITSIISNACAAIDYDLSKSLGWSGSIVQEINLPANYPGPKAKYTVSHFSASSGGILARLWNGSFGNPSTNAIYPSSDEFSVTWMWNQLSPTTFEVNNVFGFFHPDDPYVRVRWQLRSQDTNQVLVYRDMSVQSASSQGIASDSITIDFKTNDLWKIGKFTLSYRAYRTIGSLTQELLNLSNTYICEDRLDQNHRFFRWENMVFHPIKLYNPNGTYTTIYGIKFKKSPIHRTSIMGRCRFAGAFSKKIQPPPPDSLSLTSGTSPAGFDSPYFEYMDTLPFPIEKVDQFRHLVCDYCFFGGPKKHTLKDPADDL